MLLRTYFDLFKQLRQSWENTGSNIACRKKRYCTYWQVISISNSSRLALFIEREHFINVILIIQNWRLKNKRSACTLQAHPAGFLFCSALPSLLPSTVYNALKEIKCFWHSTKNISFASTSADHNGQMCILSTDQESRKNMCTSKYLPLKLIYLHIHYTSYSQYTLHSVGIFSTLKRLLIIKYLWLQIKLHADSIRVWFELSAEE